MDGYFERLKEATTLEERIQINREMEQRVLRDKVYMVPLFGTTAVVAYRSYVKGMIVPPDGVDNNNEWDTVWLDR